MFAELLGELDTQATVHLGNGTKFPSDGLVFETLPCWATLQKDFRKAGIPHKDGSGRVVHFHALRKTFQTLGVGGGRQSAFGASASRAFRSVVDGAGLYGCRGP